MNSDPTDRLSELASRSSEPSDRVLEALRREVSADIEPKRSLSRSARVAISIGVVWIGFLLVTAKALTAEPGAVLIGALGLGTGTGALLFAGAVPGNGLWGRPARRLLLVGLSILTFVALSSTATHFSEFSTFLAPETGPAASCALHAFIKGAATAAALIFVWRKTDPFSPRLSGAILGLLGGLAGTFSVGILCPSSEGFHLTLGHGLAALAICGIGFVAGRKWMTP